MLTFLINPLRRNRSRLADQQGRDLRDLPHHISDKTARDIGMTTAELARHRFQWPSQGKDRPLI